MVVRGNNAATYAEFSRIVNEQKNPLTLRGLFEFSPPPLPIPLDEVEPAKEIVKRFATGPCRSVQSPTRRTSTLARAMNTIGRQVQYR